MDSQGRSRLIVGGLTLAAVVLVISLLVSQQNARVPIAVESPFNEQRAGTPAVEQNSPLAVPDRESPLANPGSTMSGRVVDASPPVSDTSALSEPSLITETSVITATSALTDSADVTPTMAVTTAILLTDTVASPASATAQSTVTVTLVGSAPLRYGFEVIASYPHDPAAYTQGLQYVNGLLYEGTGLYGRSTLRRVNLESGAVEQQIQVPDQYFGEGIYVLEDRIYQLTWQSNVAFLYDRTTFELIDQFSYPTEGWGLTYDGQHLIMSDGSATIFRRDPETFAEVGRFTVLERGDPVNLLNELEYINGAIWANIWLSDEVVIIDPASGQVTGRIDFSGLLPAEDAEGAEVLNGIAYDAEQDRIFVTGKFWPTLFEIKLVPR